MCQGFSYFSAFFALFCINQIIATSSQRVRLQKGVVGEERVIDRRQEIQMPSLKLCLLKVS